MYRSTTTDEDLGELTKTHNPEEIDIDDDSDDDENVEGECNMYKRHIIFCIFLVHSVQNVIRGGNCSTNIQGIPLDRHLWI